MTNRGKTKSEPSLQDLLVRQVSCLVSAAAETMSSSVKVVLEMEAGLYRTLAEECAAKAKLTEGLIKHADEEDEDARPSIGEVTKGFRDIGEVRKAP